MHVCTSLARLTLRYQLQKALGLEDFLHRAGHTIAQEPRLQMTVHLAVPPAAIFCSGRLQEKSRGLLTRSFRNAQRPRVSALRHGSPVCRHQASAADRQACASKLLRVLCGQPLPDHREAANLTASVRLLDVHLAADCLLAWSAFDSQLSSCKAAASLHSFLSRKVLAVPSDIEHSQCETWAA